MYPTPKPQLSPNTYAYESEPMVKPTGFREYDARWILEKEINLLGIQSLGLAEGGVDWALDENNAKLITPEMKAKVESIKADIIAGKIKVHDYMSDNSCKY